MSTSLDKDKPLVSVVTPAFNAMPYIRETVESIREQDYANIEHIVMDGGSNDGTREYLATQQHVQWSSEPDRGQSHALNKAFAKASGEIVGWLNADDVYVAGAVSKAVTFLQLHDDVDLVYGDLQIIDESSNPVGETRSRPFDLEKLLYFNFMKQPTVFMRRRLLDKLVGVDESLHYTMDREFWLRAAVAGSRIEYLGNEVLAGFRLCPGTKSFEDTPEFRVEWGEILEKLAASDDMEPALRRAARAAHRKTLAQYHVAKMTQFLEARNRNGVFSSLARAIGQDPGLLLNRGIWKFATMGLMGIRPDRLRKFRKNV